MDTPGVLVRPLRTVVGSSEFSELILDDVRVPVTARVGAENDGWRVAMVTFSFERALRSSVTSSSPANLIEETVAIARSVRRPGGGTLWDDTALRRDVGRLTAEVRGLWALIQQKRLLGVGGHDPRRGRVSVQAAVTESRQRIGDSPHTCLGRASLAMSDLPGGPGNARIVEDRVNTLSFTIAAGTSQIQKDILAERVLGLPKESRWTSR